MPYYVYIDTYISGFTFYLFQVRASNYSFQIQVTDARGCPVKFICFKISAIRLHMHTYINGHVYNSGAWTPNNGYMQSCLRTRFAIIILQSVLCTPQLSHSNKHSHRLSLRMKFEAGTLDQIIYDTHTHLKCKHGFRINHIDVLVHMCTRVPENP